MGRARWTLHLLDLLAGESVTLKELSTMKCMNDAAWHWACYVVFSTVLYPCGLPARALTQEERCHSGTSTPGRSELKCSINNIGQPTISPVPQSFRAFAFPELDGNFQVACSAAYPDGSLSLKAGLRFLDSQTGFNDVNGASKLLFFSGPGRDCCHDYLAHGQSMILGRAGVERLPLAKLSDATAVAKGRAEVVESDQDCFGGIFVYRAVADATLEVRCSRGLADTSCQATGSRLMTFTIQTAAGTQVVRNELVSLDRPPTTMRAGIFDQEFLGSARITNDTFSFEPSVSLDISTSGTASARQEAVTGNAGVAVLSSVVMNVQQLRLRDISEQIEP